MFRIREFRQIAAPVTWVLAIFYVVLIFAVVFRTSAKELAILFAIDALVLNPIIYLIDPKIFLRLYPDSRAYFFGLDHEQIARMTLDEKRTMLDSMMRLPGRRAVYGLVTSVLYKIPPALVIVLFVW